MITQARLSIIIIIIIVIIIVISSYLIHRMIS